MIRVASPDTFAPYRNLRRLWKKLSVRLSGANKKFKLKPTPTQLEIDAAHIIYEGYQLIEAFQDGDYDALENAARELLAQRKQCQEITGREVDYRYYPDAWNEAFNIVETTKGY